MIRIHRAKPLAHVDERAVRLTPTQYDLLTILGMMDNRLVSPDLLLELVWGSPVPLPADRHALWVQMSRLRRKLGRDWIRHRRYLGYQLNGPVEFYGTPLPS